MSDILFQCPECSKVLCVSDKAAGKRVSCTDCGTPIEVLKPPDYFNCIKCGCALAAFGDIRGKSAQCPNCQEMILVPQSDVGGDSPRTETHIVVQCPNCASSIELEGSKQDWIGQKLECPKCNQRIRLSFPDKHQEQRLPVKRPRSFLCRTCGKPLAAGTVVCLSCGTDQKTGNRVQRKMLTKRKSGVGANILIALTIAAVLIIVLGFLITTNEEMPKKAKFYYNMTTKIIVPFRGEGSQAFYPVSENPDGNWDGVADWSEIGNPSGRFAEYHLPKGPGWDNFKFYGASIPVWKTLLYHYQSRWDEKGRWRC